MSTEPVNYEAVLADLEARKAQIESAIQAIRALAGMAQSVGTTPQSGGLTQDAFLGMSIPEATKKLLSTLKRKQSTQEIITALENGGLPRSAYNTVYAVLSRRASKVGDIVNMRGDWGLAEWYPNYKPKKSKDAASDELTPPPESGGLEPPHKS